MLQKLDNAHTIRLRLARKPGTRQARDHEVKGIRRRATMRFRIGQRIDYPPEFENRARPALRQDPWRGPFMLRAPVPKPDRPPVACRGSQPPSCLLNPSYPAQPPTGYYYLCPTPISLTS